MPVGRGGLRHLGSEAHFGVRLGPLHAGPQGSVAPQPAIQRRAVDARMGGRRLAGVARAQGAQERLDALLGGL